MFFSSGWAVGQSAPGDIAFTAFNADGDDDFAIVALVDIPANTTIYFSDNEPNVDGSGFLDYNEGQLKWATGGVIIDAGTIVVFTDTDNDSNTSFGASLGILSDPFGRDPNLAVSGDALYAVAGTDNGSAITVSAWLAGIQNAADSQGVNFGQTGLAVGTTFINFYSSSSPDGGYYSGTRNGKTIFSDYLILLGNRENWVESVSDGESTLPISTNAFRIDNNWTGTTETGWATSGNWSDGIPTANHDVTIPTGKTPIIAASTSANCYNLTLEGDATLNIVSSSETANGSLIFGGAYTGSATAVTYSRYFPDAEWHLLGSPFVGQTINSTFLSNNSISGMKDYTENPDGWASDYYPSNTPNIDFLLGKGYATKRSTSGSVTLTGIPNNTTVDITLTRDHHGWNLLSNPFTSAIASNIAGNTNNLLSDNAAVLDPNYTALYIWDPGSGSYKIINHAGGSPAATLTQNYLQVGQGFFVKSANPATGIFSISPDMQSHQMAIAFKSDENPWASIVLNAETNSAQTSTRIVYHETMSRGLDIGYDAGVLKSGSLVLYSHLINDNGTAFGVQCLPPDYEHLVVPIGLDSQGGETITFKVTVTNIPEEYAVVLEDRAKNLFLDLSEAESKYSILLEEGSNGLGRFYLHTSFKSALGLDNLDTKNNAQLFVYQKANLLLVRGVVELNTTARIYSITGQLMIVIALEQSTENRIPFDGDAGIYLIRITNEKGETTQKFTWTN
jgi:hypothetical protein